jgi:hypothetical protein
VTHTNHQRASTGENSIRCSERTPRCTLSGSPSALDTVADVRLGIQRVERDVGPAAHEPQRQAADLAHLAEVEEQPDPAGTVEVGRRERPGVQTVCASPSIAAAREVGSRTSLGTWSGRTRVPRRRATRCCPRSTTSGPCRARTARRAAPPRSAPRRSPPSRACGARHPGRANAPVAASSGSSTGVRFTAAAPGSSRAVSSDGRLTSSGVSASASAAPSA